MTCSGFPLLESMGGRRPLGARCGERRLRSTRLADFKDVRHRRSCCPWVRTAPVIGLRFRLVPCRQVLYNGLSGAGLGAIQTARRW